MFKISQSVERKFTNSLNINDLEIETDSGWQPITTIHKTIPYNVWHIETESGFVLDCADTHIVFDHNMSELYVKDIRPYYTKIITQNGPELVTLVKEHTHTENMYDLTVLHEDHRFFSNGILSHNTTLINALSYGLYGSAISDIKINNLINKTNQKNMLVSVDFDIDGLDYRIERGRKPNLLKFYKDSIEQKNANESDEAQGDSRETQKDIVDLLGLSHDMFKHAVALNTYTIPFLSMRAADQKNIIEELLGITTLTEKAESLKTVNKTTKDRIKEEEVRLDALIKANMHIEEQLDGLKKRQRVWKIHHEKTISDYVTQIEKLIEVDIETEIQSHKNNAKAREDAKTEWYRRTAKNQKKHDAAMKNYIASKEKVTTFNANVIKHNADITDYNNWIASLEADNTNINRRMQSLEHDIVLIDDHKCHACEQELHDEKQEAIKASKEKELADSLEALKINNAKILERKQQLVELGLPQETIKDPIQPVAEIVDRIEPDVVGTFYISIDEAHNHKSTLETLTSQLETALATNDPYAEQVADMQANALVEITYDDMNNLVELQEHQAFLLKLLSSKDSFIRKKIIDQNLAYLNNRLTHYLQEIGLPHVVRFMSDLTVEISDLGRELDFDNLSRGERTRLILSLSWAFRDVWESLSSHINLLFVDELVDSGLDTQGVESALKIMKGMSRERGKSVWLVSHREELLSRVNNTMKVIKSGGFTVYDSNAE